MVRKRFGKLRCSGFNNGFCMAVRQNGMPKRVREASNCYAMHVGDLPLEPCIGERIVSKHSFKGSLDETVGL